MQFQYVNWSTRIFDGFYESYLFNSDTEYYLNELLQDEEHPQEYELDYNAYEQAISAYAVELLNDFCVTFNDDNIIKSMDFVRLSSPKYYNFEADKLVINIDFNLTKLKSYIKLHKTDFNTYLKDNFTSYDGFISFISNNYNDFMADYYYEPWDKDKCINVMIEYYILRCIYETDWQHIKDNHNESDYHYKLYEIANEYQINYAKEVMEVA